MPLRLRVVIRDGTVGVGELFWELAECEVSVWVGECVGECGIESGVGGVCVSVEVECWENVEAGW